MSFSRDAFTMETIEGRQSLTSYKTETDHCGKNDQKQRLQKSDSSTELVEQAELSDGERNGEEKEWAAHQGKSAV